MLFVFVRIRKSKDGRADFSGHTAAAREDCLDDRKL